ncbi:MAG: sugar phosphate nucleotidyltransferase, partial [Candidatus Binataceae bacterium]
MLAGGDGSRLMPLTRQFAGYDLPKQFCPIFGEETLLGLSLERVSLTIPPDNTLTVLNRAHENLYRPMLRGISERNLVVQPANRGTAPAILYGLLRSAKLANVDSIAIFPSDHYVSDDALFMRHVDAAFEVVKRRSDLMVLLGITPDGPEVEYGWIEPDKPMALGPYTLNPFSRVRRFWEKPQLAAAQRLLRKGCLWNSFVMVAPLTALYNLLKKALPGLCGFFQNVRQAIGTPLEDTAAQELYMRLPDISFSHRVLASHPRELAVLPVA